MIEQVNVTKRNHAPGKQLVNNTSRVANRPQDTKRHKSKPKLKDVRIAGVWLTK